MSRSLQPVSVSRRSCLGLAALLLWLLTAATAFAAQEVFLRSIADLPLMPGLREVEDAGIVFDKPSGRIVQAFAEGAVAPAGVLSFYDRTLPQLGWRAEGGGSYRREGERLIVDMADSGRLLIVRFTLAPE